MTSKIATERAATLAGARAAAERKAERARAELNERLNAIITTHEAEVAHAEKAAETMRATCATEIAAAFHAEVSPLVKAWMVEPSRKLGLELATLFRKFDERALHELGAALWDSALAVAFAIEVAKLWPAAVTKFGSPDANMGGRVVDVLGAFRNSLTMGPADVSASLAAVESEVVTIARIATGTPPDECVRRFELRKACATYGDAVRALSAFDEVEAARQQQEFAASYDMPEPPSWRSRLSGALFGGG